MFQKNLKSKDFLSTFLMLPSQTQICDSEGSLTFHSDSIFFWMDSVL